MCKQTFHCVGRKIARTAIGRQGIACEGPPAIEERSMVDANAMRAAPVFDFDTIHDRSHFGSVKWANQ